MSGPAAADARAIAAAVRSVGTRITLIAAALVSVVALGAVAFVVRRSRPRELLEAQPDRIYLDGREALAAIGVLGVVAIVLAGVAAVLVARRAVRPLGRALALQRAFVADASHELRTPLAVLDARVQLLQRQLPDDDALRPRIDELRRDAQVLTDVVTELLDAAGATEESTRQGGSGPAEVDAVTAATAEALRVVAAERGVQLASTLAAHTAVTMPAATVRRVVTALVDNAIAHSPAGGVVTIATERRGASVRLTVTDHGQGIVGIDPDRVFDRFARATRQTEATETRRGFGLGLAIVREAVTRFGGSVSVAATSPQGTVLAVELPVAAARGGTGI